MPDSRVRCLRVRLRALPVPPDLYISVVHPHCKVSTADARRLVRERRFSLDEIVPNLGNVAGFVAIYSGQ